MAGGIFVGTIIFDVIWVLLISPFIARRVSFNHGLDGLLKFFRLEAWLLTITAVIAVIAVLIFAQDDFYKLMKYWAWAGEQHG